MSHVAYVAFVAEDIGAIRGVQSYSLREARCHWQLAYAVYAERCLASNYVSHVVHIELPNWEFQKHVILLYFKTLLRLASPERKCMLSKTNLMPISKFLRRVENILTFQLDKLRMDELVVLQSYCSFLVAINPVK